MRVLTFSRHYPATHTKKGELTKFPEKIWQGLFHPLSPRIIELSEFIRDYHYIFPTQESWKNQTPKLHTIRAGKRWKAGDWFSPRVWNGKPRQPGSKHVIIAPDMQLTRVAEITIDWEFNVCIDGVYLTYHNELAANDGLTNEDFHDWFIPHVKKLKEGEVWIGQILIWSNYKLPY